MPSRTTFSIVALEREMSGGIGYPHVPTEAAGFLGFFGKMN